MRRIHGMISAPIRTPRRPPSSANITYEQKRTYLDEIIFAGARPWLSNPAAKQVSFTNGGGIRAWGASPGVDNSQRTRHTSRSNSAVAVVSRGPEDEDDAYEFIVDDGVAPGEGSEASGVGRWTSWGLRSAATGGSGSG